MKKHAPWIVAIVLLAVGVFFFLQQKPDSIANRKPLRIGINVWSGYAHAFVAQQKGFFKDNGVEVKLVLFKELSQAVEAYKKGELDGLFDVFTNTIVESVEGYPRKVVYVSDYSQSGDVIVGRSEFTSLADLKSKTVSFEKLNSFSHIFVLKALKNMGLDESTVKFKKVSAHNVLTALESGSIDAGHTWEPVLSKALSKGYKVLATAGDIPGIITDVLSFKATVIKARKDDIQAVVKSLFAARYYVLHNWDESIKIMATAEGMSIEEMASGLAGVFQPDIAGNITALTPSNKSTSLYSSGDFINRFLMNRGQLDHIIDLDEVIDARFVMAMKQK
jgi:NitT/TauT family transport system substrate-binding protein